MVIKTKGRARQKAFTLARKAGVELKAVVFTKKEAEKIIGYPLRGRFCTKWDKACGRAFQDFKVIWLSLPVNIDTIAHEIMHLVTKTSHNTSTFQNQTIALSRGMAPGKARVSNYLVTVTTVYQISELTAHAAKEHYGRGNVIKKTLSARRETK